MSYTKPTTCEHTVWYCFSSSPGMRTFESEHDPISDSDACAEEIVNYLTKRYGNSYDGEIIIIYPESFTPSSKFGGPSKNPIRYLMEAIGEIEYRAIRLL